MVNKSQPTTKTTMTKLVFGKACSVDFPDRTVGEVYALLILTFKNARIERTRTYTGSPLQKTNSLDSLKVVVRDSLNQGSSKSKYLYGISSADAKNYFLDNYRRFL